MAQDSGRCHLFFPPVGVSTFAHRLLGSRFMVWTGRLSYSLYLFHVLGTFIAVELGLGRATHLVACSTFAYAAAWASYRFVETPGRSLGRRAAEALTRSREQRAS